MKKRVLAMLLAVALVAALLPVAALAEGPFQVSSTGKTYSTLSAAISAASDGDTIKLLDNATTSFIIIEKGITLDLGGNTLKIVDISKNTIGIAFTEGTSTIKNGTIIDDRVFVDNGAGSYTSSAGAVMVYAGGVGTSLATSNVTIKTYQPVDKSPNIGDYSYILYVRDGAKATLNAGTNLIDEPFMNYTGGEYTTDGSIGVTVLGGDSTSTYPGGAALTVNDGVTINTYGFAISGNGAMHDTTIDINGGQITSREAAAVSAATATAAGMGGAPRSTMGISRNQTPARV